MYETSDRPAHGAQEWAEHNVNIQTGCEHGCKYCYALCMAARFRKTTYEQWLHPTLRGSAVSKGYRKYPGRIMFPTTHDITPHNLPACTIVLQKMLKAGNEVLVVSKPHLECIKVLCIELSPYRSQVMFRVTIGSTDSHVLSFWEPHATGFEERLNALKVAFESGYRTSVSCEPLLDTNVEALVGAVRPYVNDSIWLGRVNQLRNNVTMIFPNDAELRRKAEELLASQTDAWMISIYEQFKNDPLIKWKDSFKKVIGLHRPTEFGMDV